jgi:hypothetical protein
MENVMATPQKLKTDLPYDPAITLLKMECESGYNKGTCTPMFFVVVFLLFCYFVLLFYCSYVHTRLGSFLPPASIPSLTTHSAPSLSRPPLNTQQKLFCPYF